MSGARRVGGCLRVLGCLQVLGCRRGRASVESGGAGPGTLTAWRGLGDAEAGSAGRPGSLDVSAPGAAAAAAIYAVHPGAAPPRHGLRSRLPRPRRPEWAGVTGTQSRGPSERPRGGRGARWSCLAGGAGGDGEKPPAPGERAPIAANGEPPARGGDPTPVSATPGPGAAPPEQGTPQPETLPLSWARSRGPGHRRPRTLCPRTLLQRLDYGFSLGNHP